MPVYSNNETNRKAGTQMHQCNQCNREFTEEPLYSITDDLTYCSDECIPEEATDEPYSFEYFNLVSSYRHFAKEKRKLKT